MTRTGTSAHPGTPHPDAGATPVTFVAFGDVEDDVTGLRDLIAALPREPAPAFGVLLGDTVRRASRRRYALLREALLRAAPPFPVLAVPGNRDRATDADWFVETFGARTWSVRHGDVVFVGLDNADGPLSPESVGTLARAPAGERAILFVHQPVHLAGQGGPAARAREARRRELRAAVGGRRIDAVLSGHVDLWQESRDADGTLHVVNGHVPGPRSGTVPTAAVVTVRPGAAGGVSVERVQVPARVDVFDTARWIGVNVTDRAARLVVRSRVRARQRRAAAL